MRHFIVFAVAAAFLAGGAVSSWAIEPKAPSQAELAKAAKAQAEQAALQAAMQGGITPGMPVGNNPALRQFDRDGDGKLSAQEIGFAREMARRMRGGGGAGSGGGGPQRGFTPGGGAPAPAAPAKETKPEKVSPLVKRFDKDGDGKLNEEEKVAAQADLKGKKKDRSEKPKNEKDKDKNGEKPADKAGK
jgi:Ca2+-binding EF-hand superfamily protein